jgi:hypothetical protein
MASASLRPPGPIARTRPRCGFSLAVSGRTIEGYYLIEAGNGVMSSIDFFENSAQADESTRVAATWMREEKLETALPNPPKITDGEVIVHKKNGFVGA